MRKYDVKLLKYEDEQYPECLRNIHTPPTKLYCMGNINLLNKKRKIAIIGCRDYSEYGRLISQKFAYELARMGFVIVSGAARGIDSFSHKATLNTKTGTIAVLGNGLNYIYPPENKELEEQILNNNGLIISEYDMGTKPSKYTFPARNRIISAVSDGVLVIEARKNSGSQITVDYALDQGKNVYAVPGDITRINTEGTNELIKQGAKIVTNVNDILEDFKSI